MGNARNVDRNSSGQRSHCAADALIAELAQRQNGVVARRQLLDLGLDWWEIDYRLKIGRLHGIHRGVYAVGHEALSREARWLAAVNAVGPDAVLSHRAAGALWGLLHPAQRTQVTAPRRVRSPSGVTVHRSSLPPDEMTVERDIPTTTVPRTLLDLASVLSRRQVERAIEEAEVARLTDPLSLRDLVQRYPRRKGTGVIRAILDADEIGNTRTRSELEEAFLAFVRANSLPGPELNAPIALGGGKWVEGDCVWRARRVVVELDSRRFHGTPRSFERDRAKDRALAVAGWRVVRVTWLQLRVDAGRLVADLRALLYDTPAASSAVASS